MIDWEHRLVTRRNEGHRLRLECADGKSGPVLPTQPASLGTGFFPPSMLLPTLCRLRIMRCFARNEESVKVIVRLICLTLLLASACVAARPVLLFSDLQSGPAAGWSAENPQRGAAVTVWGYGFGSTRGESTVSVGDRVLAADSDYAVWGEAWPTPFWQRITFWLNDSMTAGDTQITVTVDGRASNPLEFTIREGRIFFVHAGSSNGNGSVDSPFSYLQAGGGSGYVAAMQPGDIYYFRHGVYDTESNGGNSVLWIRDSEPSGSPGSPIALLAYPGEHPRFQVDSYDINFHNPLQLSNDHMVTAGFEFDSEWRAVSLAGDHHRFVGNDVVGLKGLHGQGTGTVVTRGGGSRILGNAIHGGRSGSRFDHATYFSGCADEVGNHLGWNYVHDNDFGRGPELSINHQGDRCEPGTEILKAHFVFNNIVDCSPQRAVAINVYDLSFDEGETPPEPTYVYNNVFANCGTLDLEDTDNVGWAATVIANTADTRFYNNVLYNSEYLGFRASGGIISSHFRNNIVVMDSSSLLDGRDDLYVDLEEPADVTLTDNLFHDKGTGTTSDAGIDAGANIVGPDPEFLNPAAFDFSIRTTSPAFNSGASDLLFEVPAPDYAPINRDIRFVLRNGPFDMGAFEQQMLIFVDRFQE